MLDPSQIYLDKRTLSIGELLSKDRNITYASKNDHTEFNSDVVESVLVRVPLRPLVVLGSDDSVYTVVNTFQFNSIVNYYLNLYKLSNLKYLDERFNCTFEEMHIAFRRRILETNVEVITIPHYTPENIKADIIRRLT